MEGFLVADTEFSPLMIPVSSVSKALDSTYRVVSDSGETVTLEASSAAEAVKKSGVARPLRVTSAAQDQRRLMERHVLHPEARSAATDVDIQHFVPDFRSLVVENLEEEEKPLFEECSLADIAARRLDKLPEKAPKRIPMQQVKSPPPFATEPEDVSETAAADAVPPVVEIIPPDRALTPEEVDRLIHSKEV